MFLKNRKIALILSFGLLFSCNTGNKGSKIPLYSFSGVLQETDNGSKGFLNYLTSEDFDSLLSKKASFPLFVYSQGCGTCDLFSYTIQGYLKEKGCLFPFRTLSNYLSSPNALSISDSSVLFYKEGNLFKQVTRLEEEYSDDDAFLKRMEEYTYSAPYAILNGYDNRLGYSYSSDYPTYQINRSFTSSLPFRKEEWKGRTLKLINIDKAEDFSFLSEPEADLYFLDGDSWNNKSQELSLALGLDVSDFSGKDRITVVL